MIDPPNPSPQLRLEGLLAGRPGQWTFAANNTAQELQRRNRNSYWYLISEFYFIYYISTNDTSKLNEISDGLI